ncbi:Uncharacterised protein [Mycobacterium tuberculosis]|nr:Uncharacterised protein [Mycobacterium tuberculosis]
MVERHHRNGGVPRAQPVPGDDGADRAGDVCVRPGDHLRQAGRPAGEHDHGVIGSQSLGRRGCGVRLGGGVQVDRQGATRGAAVTADVHRERPPPGGGFCPVVRPICVNQHHPGSRGLASDALLGDGQRRIQRHDDEIRTRRRQQGDDEFGVAAHAQRDPVTGQQAGPRQLAGQLINQTGQVAVADRDAIRGDDERRSLGQPGRRHLDKIGDARAEVGCHRERSFHVFGVRVRHDQHSAGLACPASNTDPLTVDRPRKSLHSDSVLDTAGAPDNSEHHDHTIGISLHSADRRLPPGGGRPQSQRRRHHLRRCRHPDHRPGSRRPSLGDPLYRFPPRSISGQCGGRRGVPHRTARRVSDDVRPRLSQRPARAGERHHELLPDDPDLRIEQPADGRPAARRLSGPRPAQRRSTVREGGVSDRPSPGHRARRRARHSHRDLRAARRCIPRYPRRCAGPGR